MPLYTKVSTTWKPINIASGTNQAGQDYGWGFNVGSYYDSEENKQFYLIVAPTSGGESTKLWKINSDIDGSACQNLVNGVKNCSFVRSNDTFHPAMGFCRNLTLGGYSDWYLPAKDELNFIYLNRSILTASYSFAVAYYWSSTECSSNTVSATSSSWCQSMSAGFQYYNNKTNNYRVRAVRRLAL